MSVHEKLINEWITLRKVGNISIGLNGAGADGVIAIEAEETLKMTKEDLFEFIKKQKEPMVIIPNFFKGGISSVKIKRIFK